MGNREWGIGNGALGMGISYFFLLPLPPLPPSRILKEGLSLRNLEIGIKSSAKTSMSATQSNNLPLWVQDRDKVIAESTDVEWRYQTPPDYSRSKENLAKESIHNHLEGTLEAIVQNLVRTFEMEVSFKANPQQWLSIVNDKFRVSTNGG